jgi:hypothetical protein
MSTIRSVKDGEIPYSQRKRDEFLARIPRLAADGVDAYVAGLSLHMPDLGHIPVAGWRAMPFLNGGLALAHGIYGATRLFSNHSDDPLAQGRARTMGVGELLTAAGFAGLAFGLGLWALPLLAIGEVTTNFAQFA